MEKQQSLSALSDFYTIFRITLFAEKNKSLNASCLPTLIKLNQNKLREILSKSAKDSFIINKDMLAYLVENQLIMESEEPKKYVITARGIALYESEQMSIPNTAIYDYITKEIMKKSYKTSKNLSDREKLILFVLFSMHCFSKDCGLDVLRKIKEQYWMEIFDKCITFLQTHQFTQTLDLDFNKFLWKDATKKPIVTLVTGPAAELKKLTKSIFSNVNDQGIFYLDIINSTNIDKVKLNLIFEKIFDQKSIPEKKEILKFSRNLVKDYDTKVFDNIQLAYTAPRVSTTIEEYIISS